MVLGTEWYWMVLNGNWVLDGTGWYLMVLITGWYWMVLDGTNGT